MSTLCYERVHENLRELQLSVIDTILDTYLDSAIAEKKPVLEILDYLFAEEQKARMARKRELNGKMSKIPYIKTLDTFDFSFQPGIDTGVINDLRTQRYIYSGANIVLLGPPGVGKTHLAIGIGLEALDAGKRVYFLNAAVLSEKLIKAESEGKLQRYLRSLNNYDVLIIDEFGYLPLDSRGAYCFFQLICSRYESKSVIITSNKSYSRWGDIFNDTVIATAILDRVLHHCTTINIKGKSYRMIGRTKSDGDLMGMKSK